MKQESLFEATRPIRDRRSAAILKANEFQKNNEEIARIALLDPARYPWLQSWALIVMENAALRAESEVA